MGWTSSKWVNFDFEVKFDLEGQGQSPPKTIGILTKVFYTYGPNLVILAWTGDELSRGQTWWRTDGRRDGQTQATTIPEGQYWPRVTRLVWTIWTPLSAVPKRLLNLITHALTWCCQATIHYLNQCSPRSLSPYGVTRPEWVNEVFWEVYLPDSSNISQSMTPCMAAHDSAAFNPSG